MEHYALPYVQTLLLTLWVKASLGQYTNLKATVPFESIQLADLHISEIQWANEEKWNTLTFANECNAYNSHDSALNRLLSGEQHYNIGICRQVGLSSNATRSGTVCEGWHSKGGIRLETTSHHNLQPSVTIRGSHYRRSLESPLNIGSTMIEPNACLICWIDV